MKIADDIDTNSDYADYHWSLQCTDIFLRVVSLTALKFIEANKQSDDVC